MTSTGRRVEVASVRVASTHGRVRVIGEDRHDVVVDGRATVTEADGHTTIDAGGGTLVVHVPAGTDVVMGTTSGRASLEGSLGEIAAVSESGRIKLEHARSADVRTTSGRVEIGRVDDRCRARTVNGRLTIGACAGADLSTESGRIIVAEASGPVHAHCTSGRIDIAMTAPHDVEAETVSGRISISLPPGIRAHVPAAGSTDGPRPSDCDCTVLARSVSGRVDVSTR